MNYAAYINDYDKPRLLPSIYAQKFETIYLGAYTNIVCIKNRIKISEEETSFDSFADENYKAQAILYLGKIIFKKNREGNIAPSYIPSKITESSFDGLNMFWLNEPNPNYTPRGEESIIYGVPILSYVVHPRYFKSIYYRTSKNITLNKEQIISYFTQLHLLNATFIKNYIDTINAEDGIRSYYINDGVYGEMMDKGLITRERTYYKGNKVSFNTTREESLIALDYMSKIPRYHRYVPFFDELFYAYLVWSLREYIISDFNAEFQDKYNLLFNLGAYKKNEKYIEPEIDEEGSYSYNLYTSLESGKIALFYENTYSLFSCKKHIEITNMSFLSPNQSYSILTEPNIPIFAPSPLGNYYFQLRENKNIFVEFYSRIYPSIDNPPKGWSKTMMQKLELSL